MKAVIKTKYGSPEVLQLQEVAKPAPKDNEVLVKIHAASVTMADCMMRTGTPYFGRLFMGLTKPKYPIAGTGFAGEVVEAGSEVSKFKVGDQIFGESIFGAGTNAEYVCVSENGVVAIKPDNMSYEEAASVSDGALTSINFLRNLGEIKPGQKVLINGASGSLGSAAVQLAKQFGAEVTGVCSTANLDLVASLGADEVIDYTQTDFRKGSLTYDIIYDTVGKLSFSSCKNSLTENGSYISPVLKVPLLLQVLWTSMVGSKKAKFSATGILPVEELRILLQDLKALFEEGSIKSVIDRRYSLEEITEAHRYVDRGHKKGNVVMVVGPV